MAFLQVQFYSDTLTVASSAYVILPEPRQGIGMKAAAADELPKVLYLLHGYSDDHSIWMLLQKIPYQLIEDKCSCNGSAAHGDIFGCTGKIIVQAFYQFHSLCIIESMLFAFGILCSCIKG